MKKILIWLYQFAHDVQIQVSEHGENCPIVKDLAHKIEELKK